jgi:hypothetical protein
LQENKAGGLSGRKRPFPGLKLYFPLDDFFNYNTDLGFNASILKKYFQMALTGGSGSVFSLENGVHRHKFRAIVRREQRFSAFFCQLFANSIE